MNDIFDIQVRNLADVTISSGGGVVSLITAQRPDELSDYPSTCAQLTPEQARIIGRRLLLCAEYEEGR